ncbi:YraN family protein [Dehalococcoidia bacterium]|nr:YraN family protein [Dehalococcoidia bacterium]
MADTRKLMGAFGERAAREYLKKRGYKILETNFRGALGEIDIVAQDGDCVVFVEVRTRRSLAFGTPEESITAAKKARLIKLAQSYIQGHRDPSCPWRIDIVAIEIGQDGKITRIELIENAVESSS